MLLKPQFSLGGFASDVTHGQTFLIADDI